MRRGGSLQLLCWSVLIGVAAMTTASQQVLTPEYERLRSYEGT